MNPYIFPPMLQLNFWKVFSKLYT